MGQDSWNLTFGSHHSSKTRKGTSVKPSYDKEGYGSQVVPGYAGPKDTKLVKKRAGSGKKGLLAKSEELIPIGKQFPMKVKKRK